MLRKIWLLFLALFITNFIFSQKCYFSPSGDTILLVKFVAWGGRNDSSRSDYLFYARENNGIGVNLFKKYSYWVKYVKHDDFLDDTVKKYRFCEESAEVANDTGNIYSSSFTASKFKFLKRGPISCSKGCWCSQYYSAKADLSFKVGQQIIILAKGAHLIYSKSYGFHWGERPKKDSGVDCKAAARARIFKMPGKDKYVLKVSFRRGKHMKHFRLPPDERIFIVERK